MGLREILYFGEFTLEIEERRLRRGTETIRLAPKAFDVLVALVRHPGRLVGRNQAAIASCPTRSVTASGKAD